MNAPRSLIGTAALILMASLVGGCASYDYLQRTDRISYRAGNAVKANLERETINPWSWSMYDTTGLGKNGSVIPSETQGATGSAKQPSAEPSTAPPPPPA